jgi:hypothetical protein
LCKRLKCTFARCLNFLELVENGTFLDPKLVSAVNATVYGPLLAGGVCIKRQGCGGAAEENGCQGISDGVQLRLETV